MPGIPPFPPTLGGNGGGRFASHAPAAPARAYGGGSGGSGSGNVLELTPQGQLQQLYGPGSHQSRTGKEDDKDPRDLMAGGGSIPPNLGNEPLPHVFTFIGLQRSLAKVYYPSDESIQDSWDNARYMLHYLPILECLEQRQRSTALLGWHLESDDAKSGKEKKLCDDLTRIIRRIPRFMQYRESLLQALWYGRYANQQRFRWLPIDGQMRLAVDRWTPLHGDKLVFRYDDGSGEYNPDQVGIRVGTYYTEGQRLYGRWRVERLDKISTTYMGLGYFLENWERPMLALHRHKIEDGEYNEPTRAGRIHGVGIRDRIYWTWYQAVEAQAWLMEYLERSAFGIEIWSYPAGNPNARDQVYKAATERVSNGRTVVIVPIYPELEALNKPVQRIEPGMAGVSALKEILVEIFAHQIKRYILGQTLTTEAGSTGLGSNLASIHLDTYLQIIRYDAINLEETLTSDLVEPLKRFNFPWAASVPVRMKLETESPDVEGKLQAWERAFNMGVKLRAKDIMELIGASPPEGEDETLQHPAAQQQEQQKQDRLLQTLTQRMSLHPAAVAPGSGGGGAGGTGGQQSPSGWGPSGGGGGGFSGNDNGKGQQKPPTGNLGASNGIGASRPFAAKRYAKTGDHSESYRTTIGGSKEGDSEHAGGTPNRKLIERFNAAFAIRERYKIAGSWDESKHPRESAGSEKGGQFTAAESHDESYQTKKGETKTRKTWGLPGGQPLPEHAAGYYIPPGWTDVKISTDPNSTRVATGKDTKGRVQTIYRKEFVQRQSALKFSRVKEGIAKFSAMQEQNARNLQSDETDTRESAAVMRLIMATGIRPGSDRDTKAEQQAYGATTLLGKHVIQDKSGSVVLRYTGKKGVDLKIPIHDADVARDLLVRKQKAGDSGRLFGVNDSQLRKYSHSLDGGGFKTKDFRTIRGTSEALRLVRERKAKPKSDKERKAWIKEVAIAVSSVLGNTPAIALQSYIDPHVFESWGVEVKHAA